jgi:hypothetical protein
MNPNQLVDALRHFGVRIKEYPGWRSLDRPGTFDPHVLLIHDTVTGSMSDQRAAEFCQEGRSSLAGPLYSTLIGRDGTVHLIGFGKSNNAGRGNEERFRLAWQGRMPLDRELGRPDPDDYSDANAYCHGIAFTTYGAGPYTPEQIETGGRVCAAYYKAEGWGKWGAGSTLGHGEFSSRKIDPFLDMGILRSRANAIVLGNDEVWHGPTVKGETLWGIARQYDVTVQQIKDLNNLQGDVIGIGWRLRVK